jgi:hypothetical protein
VEETVMSNLWTVLAAGLLLMGLACESRGEQPTDEEDVEIVDPNPGRRGKRGRPPRRRRDVLTDR